MHAIDFQFSIAAWDLLRHQQPIINHHHLIRPACWRKASHSTHPLLFKIEKGDLPTKHTCPRHSFQLPTSANDGCWLAVTNYCLMKTACLTLVRRHQSRVKFGNARQWLYDPSEWLVLVLRAAHFGFILFYETEGAQQ